jgi:hypothetical protein
MNTKSDYEKFEIIKAKSFVRDIKAICRLHFIYLSSNDKVSEQVEKSISFIIKEVETLDKKLI